LVSPKNVPQLYPNRQLKKDDSCSQYRNHPLNLAQTLLELTLTKVAIIIS